MATKYVAFPELVAEMARNGETQETLADALGLSVSAFNRRLTGKVDWTFHEINAVCRHYNKSYEEIFKGA